LFGGESAQNLAPILEQMQQGQSAPTESRELTAKEKKEGEFINALLIDNLDVWTEIFKENGWTYKAPKLVLFSGQVSTACGGASSASGPFYCPGDQKIYMDMTFFDELKSKFGAKGGDFAVAYVVAHEIGHHVQTLLGTSAKMRQMQQGLSEAEANKLSVALELQADFYAGVWTHYNEEMNQILEPGDIEEALSAANAVGDDAIQKKMQGQVVPDSFTHGTSEQRMYWFNKGFKTGDIKQGDTFAEIR
ncbi:neutral zinc metallopeptidase, partial [uncultured Flavobacterium sp.]|uniref:KPN_02809 family neutral zinc metallopeptidase n=1 Tax=uncultured Flavobacterium sp. TaxID=165435 RepID=UPI0027DF6DB2